MDIHPFYDQPIRQNWPRRTARFDSFTAQVEIIFLKYQVLESNYEYWIWEVFQSQVEIIFLKYRSSD